MFIRRFIYTEACTMAKKQFKAESKRVAGSDLMINSINTHKEISSESSSQRQRQRWTSVPKALTTIRWVWTGETQNTLIAPDKEQSYLYVLPTTASHDRRRSWRGKFWPPSPAGGSLQFSRSWPRRTGWDRKTDIIGQFGGGSMPAFMVADAGDGGLRATLGRGKWSVSVPWCGRLHPPHL
jgi:hypothetical protein